MDIKTAARTGGCHGSTINALISKGLLNARKVSMGDRQWKWDITDSEADVRAAVELTHPQHGKTRKKRKVATPTQAPLPVDAAPANGHVNGNGHHAANGNGAAADPSVRIDIERLRIDREWLGVPYEKRGALLKLSKAENLSDLVAYLEQAGA